jgi:hydrogenase expression/formation protein HypE
MSTIKMAHGAGGTIMQSLVGDVIMKGLREGWDGVAAGDGGGESAQDVPPEALEDSAVIEGIVFTTDSHTVKPLFFPGGDIGSLSVAGTINDIAVMGARPVALSLALVIEEGYPVEELARIASSIGRTSAKAGVPVVTGDTKVMEKGQVIGIVVNTSGIGVRHPSLDSNFETVRKYREHDRGWLMDSGLRPGDAIIVTGSVGDHGIALISFREGYEFQSDLESDVAPLNHMVTACLETGGVVAMKDPTRGGLSNSVNEWADKSGCGILLDESAIPLKPAVTAACDMLGFIPYEIGNEGKLVVGVVQEKAEEVLEAIRAMPEGKDAAIIGRATDDVKGVVLETVVGGRRVMEAPAGDPIPRIC